MRKPTTFDYIFITGILILFTYLAMYIGSHPKHSICDSQPNSDVCQQETQSNTDEYDQYLQNGNH